MLPRSWALPWGFLLKDSSTNQPYTETVQWQSQYQELKQKYKMLLQNVLILLRNLEDCCWLCVYIYIYIYILLVTQPFRLVGQESEPSQTTDIALACCFLGKVLWVGYHYFPLPLDIPNFAARYLHICTMWEILVAKVWTMGENSVRQI